jgi:tetratricopeptide (TPR) repeat protein
MKRRDLMLLAVIAAALVVYANSLWNGFAYDDNWAIVRNPRVHNLANLRAIFLTPYWPNYGPELGLFRPLTIFGFASKWSIVGNAPWLFHLVSILAHAAACALVFLLLERLASQTVAFAAALLFAVHPVHTEAVANVVGQAELWVALALLSACLLYVRRPPGVHVPWRTRIGIIAIYGLGLLAKESAVVLPGLLVLLDFAQRRIELTRTGLVRYVRGTSILMILLCAVFVAYLVVRVSALGNFAGVDAAPGLPFLREPHRVLNAFRAWPEFVRLLFFPMNLSVDYAPGLLLPVDSITPMVLLGMLLTAAVVLIFLATPWKPRAGCIAGWFLITILPVSNFFFPIGVLIGERTLYTQSLAACLLGGRAWSEVRQRASVGARRLAAAAAIAVLLLFGARTVVRNPDWDSLETVWDALRRDHPESYRSQWVNASEQWYRGNAEFAERYFQIADRLWPRDSQLLNDIGNFYISQRRWDAAVEYLERSRNLTPFAVLTFEALAYAYLNAGRPNDARETALHAVKIGGSQTALMYATIGGAYDGLGRYDEAAGAWRVATRKPGGDLWVYWAMLARSLASGGHTEAALTAADSAYARIRGNVSFEAMIDRLRSAIRSNCYPKGGACDVLDGWLITVPGTAQGLANSKASAKSKAMGPTAGPALGL